jgi:hypothetical protein
MSRYLPLFIITMAGLQGCGSLPRDECQTADWYTIGYQDGRQGRPETDRLAICAKRDMPAQIASYNQGRGDGLKQFCSPRNGFRLGLEGAQYNSACPAGAEQQFLPAYEQGKEIFDAELQIRRLREILHVNTHELRNLTVTVQQKEAEMAAQNTTEERRADLLLEVSDLQETLAMVETEISGIEAALEEESRRLQNLRGRSVTGDSRSVR